MAQFTYWVYETVFIIVRFTFFRVNCAFFYLLLITLIAADVMLSV